MLSSPTNFLIIILALLQFVAPLVHAHTGEEHSKPNIHLPGFEHFSLKGDSPALHSITHPNVDACSIISIGSAIQHKKIYTDYTTAYFLPTEILSIKSVAYHSLIKLALQQQIHSKIRPYKSFSARAPPSHI
jgi:hypothetical protein